MEDSTRGRATRGRFLSAAGVTGAALAAGAWRTDGAGAAPGASKPARPSHAAGHFALELDGKGAGLVESVEGGAAVGTVVRELGRNTYYQKKHIGNVKYEEISFQAGTGLGKAFYDWVSEMLSGRGSRRSGAFVWTDFNYKELSTMSFQQALLTAVTFPALDAGAKETAYLTVEVAPETTRILSGSGATLKQVGGAKQKMWSPANFRFGIKGIDTSKVSKIDALTVKQTAATGETGENRDVELEPGKIEFPNLAIMLPESNAGSFYDWHEDFVIGGNSSDESERNGEIVYLASDQKTELARLDLFNLGIFKIAPEKQEANVEQIRRVKAEMYCERMSFTWLGETIA